MNRRNFILGLGTAATLSGAASVTGASLQDSVTPSADFRVTAPAELVVRDNQYLDEDGEDDGNYTDIEPGSFDHNETSDASIAPNMSVDNQADGDLDMALATFNDASQDYNSNTTGDQPFVNASASGTSALDGEGGEAPLEVENQTGTSQEVGISYGYGSDEGTNADEVPGGSINHLFQFFMDDGGSGVTRISPSPDETNGDNGETNNYATIGAGETKQVHLVIDMTTTIEDEIADAKSASSTGFTSSVDDVSLLSTVDFGIEQ